ncbi:MBL fold metallo-hydrolase [Amycolatopsis sp. NPDC051102]|uniref:MBL fold metallo-hydrolase n=1 Tax=Amycolatopsis sp. NPDC051102 TaxID=3155163 RepID=UPI00342974D8
MSVGTIDNNAYLRCRTTGEQLLIDAAADPATLLEPAGEAGLTSIVATHCHWAHWTAPAEVASATGHGRTRSSRRGRRRPANRPPGNGGDTIRVGEVSVTARHLVDHSPGSIALLYRGPSGIRRLFTGDSLFLGWVGDTQKDPARFASLDDVEKKIFAELPDEAWIYPGDGKDTTLGAERPSLRSGKPTPVEEGRLGPSIDVAGYPNLQGSAFDSLSCSAR